MQKLPWILALGLLGAAGCADDDPDHLRVRGEALVELGDGTRTGFEFADDVRLDDDRVAPRDGRIAGHCTIGLGGDGEHDVLSVGLSRTVPEGEAGMGLGAITVRMDDPETGEVSAELGGQTFSGASGATCTLSRAYFEPQQGLAGVIGECALTGPTGATATATVDLHFAGCSVE